MERELRFAQLAQRQPDLGQIVSMTALPLVRNISRSTSASCVL